MLHSLVIKNFRCLEDFTVEKLGRVNLIVGKNNSGKSTVLEALRIYAGNAHPQLLEDIADSHDETRILSDENTLKNNIYLPFADLFTNRLFPKQDGIEILIGESETDKDTLFIKHIFYINKMMEDPRLGGLIVDTHEIILKSDYERLLATPFKQGLLVHNLNNEYQSLISFNYSSPPRLSQYSYKQTSFIPIGFIPTQFISVSELENDWANNIAGTTENEEILKKAMCIILPEFENIYFLPSTEKSRIIKVKLSNHPRPVPLKSLGDGMTRILQLVLKLVSAQGGFLLIDEFENGLHYSTQEKIWSWLFEVAEQLDIQVFATTHSWDCIESFTKVANEKSNIEGILFRMGRSARKSNKGQIIATVFDKEALYDLTQIDVEIR